MKPGKRGKPKQVCGLQCRRADDKEARKIGRAVLCRRWTIHRERPRGFVARLMSYPPEDRRRLLGEVAKSLGLL